MTKLEIKHIYLQTAHNISQKIKNGPTNQGHTFDPQIRCPITAILRN